MMATPIPSPLPISCTDCHQPMRVEHQWPDWSRDVVIVAAECACGRIIGELSGRTIAMRHLHAIPVLRSNIMVRANADIGKEAAEAIVMHRQHILDMERLVAAAQWVRDGVSASRGRRAG